jgi:hypothetical protein
LSKIKFYLDEHIDKGIANGLRNREVDVVRCQEIGFSGKSDLAHLAWANENGFVLVTQDNDFLILHSQGQLHAGIAFAPRPMSIGEFIRSLLLIHELLTPEEMVNSIEFL